MYVVILRFEGVQEGNGPCHKKIIENRKKRRWCLKTRRARHGKIFNKYYEPFLIIFSIFSWCWGGRKSISIKNFIKENRDSKITKTCLSSSNLTNFKRRKSARKYGVYGHKRLSFENSPLWRESDRLMVLLACGRDIVSIYNITADSLLLY